MKKVILAALCALVLAVPAVASDKSDYKWPGEQTFGVVLPEGWVYEDSDGELVMFSDGTMPKLHFMGVFTPLSFDDMTLAEYTGGRLTMLLTGFEQEYGESEVLGLKEVEFEGHPAVAMQFICENDGQPTLAGQIASIDFDGYYLCLYAAAPLDLMNTLMPKFEVFMNSLIFDEDAADDSETIYDRSSQVEESLAGLVQSFRAKQKKK